jgi:predicted Zn-dependent protease
VTRALELAEQAIAAAEGDAAEAVIQTERSGFARFAGSEVHQPTLIENESISLRVVRGNRVGSAAGNRVDEEGLRELAKRAGDAADASPEDPDFPDLAGESVLPEVGGYDEATAALGPDEQARLAATVIEAAGELPVYGFFTSGEVTVSVANSSGFSGEQTTTDVSALALAATETMSGYSEQTAWAVGEIDPAAVAREAVEIAGRTADAGEVPPRSARPDCSR